MAAGRSLFRRRLANHLVGSGAQRKKEEVEYELPTHFSKLSVLLGVFLLGGVGLTQAESTPPVSGNVTFTVTAAGKTEGAPPIARNDVQLFLSNERKQINDWKKGDDLSLAILIDDSIDPSVAGNWNDLKEFIAAQPAVRSHCRRVHPEQHMHDGPGLHHES